MTDTHREHERELAQRDGIHPDVMNVYEESMKDTQDPATRALETIRAYVRQRQRDKPNDGYMSGYDDAMREMEFVLDFSLDAPGYLEQLRSDLVQGGPESTE